MILEQRKVYESNDSLAYVCVELRGHTFKTKEVGTFAIYHPASRIQTSLFVRRQQVPSMS